MPDQGSTFVTQPPPDLLENYSGTFHRAIKEGSLRSARRTWPVVLAGATAPASAVDIGCGLGTWLAALREIVPGCEVTGVDHPGVVKSDLLIPSERFIGRDLTKPIELGRRFDLCLSLEVAEHLAPEHSLGFVRSLADQSDNILFSAAVPGQGGESHLNEQWPSYWIGLFSSHGYRCFDFIRPNIWKDRQIECCYRQNILFFTKQDIHLESVQQNWHGADIVHPEMFIIHHRSTLPRTAKNLFRFLAKRL